MHYINALSDQRINGCQIVKLIYVIIIIRKIALGFLFGSKIIPIIDFYFMTIFCFKYLFYTILKIIQVQIYHQLTLLKTLIPYFVLMTWKRFVQKPEQQKRQFDMWEYVWCVSDGWWDTSNRYTSKLQFYKLIFFSLQVWGNVSQRWDCERGSARAGYC